MLQRNFLDVTPHHSLIKSLYPSNKKCYLCTATLHWPLIKWCMMESKLLLNCKYSLHRHFKPQQNFQDLHDDKKVDCYVRKIFHKRFNHVFKLLTKDFKSFPLAKLYNFCNNFFVKNVVAHWPEFLSGKLGASDFNGKSFHEFNERQYVPPAAINSSPVNQR